MFDVRQATQRRAFLGTLAAGAAALGLSGVPEVLAEPKADVDFDNVLRRLKGRKHRQLFDAPEPNHGFSVIWSWAFLHTHNSLGVPDKDVAAVVVFRHEAIPFAMEDRLWEKYKFGEAFKIDDPVTKVPSIRNVVTNIKPEDMPLPDMALEKIQKRGVEFGVCDLALTVYSSHMAKAMNMNADDVKKDWVSGILPGFHILPSGVWAVNRAQEQGFTYCFAG